MAYDVKPLVAAPAGKKEERTHGTGTGTLYVLPLKSEDGTVDIALSVSTATPSTTDTYAIGSLWILITAGLVDLYVKTAATTLTAT